MHLMPGQIEWGGRSNSEAMYRCDHAFGQEASQEDIYNEAVAPICESVLVGYNGAIIAYGQTGSGKSHSVMGDIDSETERGLLPRACERLFEMLERRRCDVEAAGKSMQITLLASYLEIYQDKMYDLLVDTRTDLY